MSFEYKRVIDAEKTLLPEEVRARLLLVKNWVYAAVDTEADTWCAYLCLSAMDRSTDMLQLQALYVKPEYRRMKVGSRLLEHAFADAASAGARSIYYKELGTNPEFLAINRPFCELCGFVKAGDGERIDFYDAKHLSENKKLKHVLKVYGSLPVKEFSDPNDPLIVRWRKRINSEGVSSGLDIYDLKHSRFYLEEGEIKAAVYVQVIRTFRAVLELYYPDGGSGGSKEKLAKLMLILHSIESLLANGCKRIYVMNANGENDNYITDLMGEPDGMCYAVEWIRYL